ncbi:phosphohexomutase domain-containing protein [Pseudoalteromonas sp. GB56]
MENLSCFKAYDIRGQLGTQLNEDIAYRIGRAYGEYFKPNTVAVGGDARETSEALKLAVAKGLCDAGVDVIDLGLTGTEETYFAAFHLPIDGAIEVTASHNPIDYNGMKLVQSDARPVSGDSGLFEIKALAEKQPWLSNEEASKNIGQITIKDLTSELVQHYFEYINVESLKPLKLVVNSGNGAAGHVVDEIERRFKEMNVPVEFIKIFHEPDATFPNGIPNPLLPENRSATSEAVIEHQADFGIAWDGDFDRCFLFDEKGEFIEGYYIVGLLAEAFLQKQPGAKVIHDPRLTWNTIDIATQCGGLPIQSKTGHAFIKERMREEDAVYGGEMSAHHYFRDFAYCDSGMIPWLLVAELVSLKQQSLSSLVAERVAAYPSPGEINSTVEDADVVIERVLTHYEPLSISKDTTDGISLEFDDWRFNLRKSNTEPLLRLNLETRGDSQLMQQKTDELLVLIRA